MSLCDISSIALTVLEHILEIIAANPQKHHTVEAIDEE